MKKFITPGRLRNAVTELTTPENSGLRIVFNPIDVTASFKDVVNAQIASKWAKPREEARMWSANRTAFKPGEVQVVAVQSDVWVMNAVMLGLEETAAASCVKKCAAQAKYEKASVHMSETTYALPGVKALVEEHLTSEGLNVYLYKAPKV